MPLILIGLALLAWAWLGHAILLVGYFGVALIVIGYVIERDEG